jgi:hypothetical protein
VRVLRGGRGDESGSRDGSRNECGKRVGRVGVAGGVKEKGCECVTLA